MIKAEKQHLVAERIAKYDAWTTERYRHRELETVKRNVDVILDGSKCRERAVRERQSEHTAKEAAA